MSDAVLASGAHRLIWVRGNDAVAFLDSLLSQSVEKVESTTVRRSLLLTPQGKLQALLWILGGADEVGLITQSPSAAAVVNGLERFRFRVDASIAAEERPTVTLAGPVEPALRAAGLESPSPGWSATPDGLIASIPFTAPGPERLVLVGDAAAALTAVMPMASDDDYQSLRIAVGEPLGGVDFDDSTIAHELGPVDEAVDFTKGCYLGQELVARIDGRGHVNRLLRRVRVPGEVALLGAVLHNPVRRLGVVTSAAAGDGTTIGLALLRKEAEPGSAATATVGGDELPAQVEDVAAAGSR